MKNDKTSFTETELEQEMRKINRHSRYIILWMIGFICGSLIFECFIRKLFVGLMIKIINPGDWLFLLTVFICRIIFLIATTLFFFFFGRLIWKEKNAQ